MGVLYFRALKPNGIYNSAIVALRGENYDEATEIFKSLGDYKDAATQALESQYQKGVTLMAAGNYDAATTVFSAISDYSDAATQAQESQYHKAAKLNASGDYDAAYQVYATIKGYRDVDSIVQNDNNILAVAAAWRAQFKVGNTVTFGAYDQDGDASNGAEPIDWLVLANDGENCTMISKYGLDAKQYNIEKTRITWESCTLRKWLNGEFLNTAFSDEELAKLAEVMVKADKNLVYSTSPGNDTWDRVFLLSIQEAKRYFTSNSDRVCIPTKTAAANSWGIEDSSSACWWWLRSPGYSSNYAANVDIDGTILSYGISVDRGYDAVRPVVVLRLS